MLKPEFEEVELGTAEIREVFRSSKFGNIAGSIVRSGEIKRGTKARVIRDGVVVAENVEIAGLRRFKDDVTEVREGFECGINLGSLQRPPGRRRHRDLRDAREAARLGDARTAHAATAGHAACVAARARRPPGRTAPAAQPVRVHRRHAATHPSPHRRKEPMADTARARKIADRIKVHRRRRRSSPIVKDPRPRVRHDHRRPGDRRPAARLGLLHRLRRRGRSAPRPPRRSRRQGPLRSVVGKQIGIRLTPDPGVLRRRHPRDAPRTSRTLLREAARARRRGRGRCRRRRRVRRRRRPVQEARAPTDDDGRRRGRASTRRRRRGR